MAFPTLSCGPSRLKLIPVDDTLVNETDGGYDWTRPRNTRDIDIIELAYTEMTVTDKNALYSHLAAVRRKAGIFTWTYPELPDDDLAGVSFDVRYFSLPEIERDGVFYFTNTFQLKVA